MDVQEFERRDWYIKGKAADRHRERRHWRFSEEGWIWDGLGVALFFTNGWMNRGQAQGFVWATSKERAEDQLRELGFEPVTLTRSVRALLCTDELQGWAERFDVFIRTPKLGSLPTQPGSDWIRGFRIVGLQLFVTDHGGEIKAGIVEGWDFKTGHLSVRFSAAIPKEVRVWDLLRPRYAYSAGPPREMRGDAPRPREAPTPCERTRQGVDFPTAWAKLLLGAPIRRSGWQEYRLELQKGVPVRVRDFGRAVAIHREDWEAGWSAKAEDLMAVDWIEVETAEGTSEEDARTRPGS